MTVNGETFEFGSLEAAPTLVGLISRLQLNPQRVAIELNGNLIPRMAYAETTVSQNDVIEIIHYVGGG